MQYYTLCSRSRFRNVSESYLMLDDIAAEGDEWCSGDLRMHELRSTFQNYTTTAEIHA